MAGILTFRLVRKGRFTRAPPILLQSLARDLAPDHPDVVSGRRKPARPYDDLPELPDALKKRLSALLSTAAKLEHDYQAVLDAAGAPAPTPWIRPLIELRTHWEADLIRFKAALQSAGVPQKSRDIIFPGLDRITRRIVELEGRVQAHRPPKPKVSGSNL